LAACWTWSGGVSRKRPAASPNPISEQAKAKTEPPPVPARPVEEKELDRLQLPMPTEKPTRKTDEPIEITAYELIQRLDKDSVQFDIDFPRGKVIRVRSFADDKARAAGDGGKREYELAIISLVTWEEKRKRMKAEPAKETLAYVIGGKSEQKASGGFVNRVRCIFNRAEDAVGFKRGMPVVIEGRVRTQEVYVILENCKAIQKGH